MNHSANRRQGSGLFAVLIISAVLGMGIYSVIDLSGTEFRANKKAAVYNEAKQAAESLKKDVEAAMDLKDAVFLEASASNGFVNTVDGEKSAFDVMPYSARCFLLCARAAVAFEGLFDSDKHSWVVCCPLLLLLCYRQSWCTSCAESLRWR